MPIKEFNSVRAIHDALDQKKISALELTRSYLDAARVSTQGAYLTFCEPRALEQAKRADELIARAGRVPRLAFPLLGVPLAVKDNLVIEGVRTTCASRILKNYIPPYTATVVGRLETAGAITLGKTSLDEFAMGGSNENSAFGPVRHPTHPDRVPGGSSGGSATAVGAGLCAAAIGSDTGGSIRLPASYCGIVGLKPTYGRVSRFGLVAFASSLDQVGPMTRTVEDAATLFDVMSGHDPLDSTSAPVPAVQTAQAVQLSPDWKRLRIGIPQEYWSGGLSPEVEKALQASVEWFAKQGATLVPLSLPHTRYAVAVYYVVAMSEASSNLSRFDGVRFGVRPPAAIEAGDLTTFYKKVRSQFGPEVKRRIILGTFALSAGYADQYYGRACQVRRLIKQDFDQAFEKVDLIAGPISVSTAFKIGEKISEPLQMYLNDIFTVPANLAGIPAISVPCGQDVQGLPIGLQLMAPAFGEDRLISVAAAFEKGRI
ncbi:Asp-tRNA(Asn)/Glu-tRNA(Gln) amidotransferase subunit GatA [Bdellovibrionota bacterium FG-1]